VLWDVQHAKAASLHAAAAWLGTGCLVWCLLSDLPTVWEVSDAKAWLMAGATHCLLLFLSLDIGRGALWHTDTCFGLCSYLLLFMGTSHAVVVLDQPSGGSCQHAASGLFPEGYVVWWWVGYSLRSDFMSQLPVPEGALHPVLFARAMPFSSCRVHVCGNL